eukprot:Gb_33163 [translate_table: standard]
MMMTPFKLQYQNTHQKIRSAKVAYEFGSSKNYGGSSEFVHMQYHMGPVPTTNITFHTIWYGNWNRYEKRKINDFLMSISATSKSSSVNEWWKTVQLYTDKTGANISRYVVVGSERNDNYSHGKILTRLSIQQVIKRAVTALRHPLPVDPKNGLYLLLRSSDVAVQDFCRAVCRFHYFTFPSIVGILDRGVMARSGLVAIGGRRPPFAKFF